MGIARVLRELRDASATLPGYLRGVAAAEGVVLNDRFAMYDWWKTEAEAVRVVFPALSFLWDGTDAHLARRPQGRKSAHRVVCSYAYRSTNLDEIQRHMLHVPDAILAWLDAFPTASRARGEGKSIVSIALGMDDAERAIAITHDVVPSTTGGPLTWSVDLALAVVAYDAAAVAPLPAP